MDNKTILEKANAAVSEGNNEGFLEYCAENVQWTFVGEQVLNGKEAIRQYMAKTYIEPPQFMVKTMIAEGDFVTAIGTINLKDEGGKITHYSYCDVWEFHQGKMVRLDAFVIAIP